MLFLSQAGGRGLVRRPAVIDEQLAKLERGLVAALSP
jgi:hypothetical protein